MAPLQDTPSRVRPEATFHAKVAGVALVTTVAVLLAACATFMLQQWAVAQEQSRANYRALAAVTADLAAPAVARRGAERAESAIQARSRSSAAGSARLRAADGQVLAEFTDPHAADAQVVAVVERLHWQGRVIGDLTLTARTPGFAAQLPQFLALTGALFFGGVGVALFLARGLAHQVIAPVTGLSEAMREVAASGRFTPVNVPTRDPLFRSLAASFNELLAKLGAREHDLNRSLEALTEARDAANAANVLKSQFLANMSHEIRTPLNGVLAMADIMATDELSPKQRSRLDVIRQSGGLLLSVINDVLDISKIEAGKLTLAEEDFDLEDVAASARASYGVLASARGLHFTVEVEPAARGPWRGDANRIRQILGNLLSNAVKFTPAGSVRGAFTLDGDGAVRLTVSDTGVGVSHDKLSLLFEK
ncbi:MAG TPA: histidine kinase dimerization/phospho-acceptor domain-containing protein, partial [Phenylobacterium sp.]|nr:histidine kinase dimerization/phospho-acceptor domain-containing protein [Phenylobacterium sp.]